MEQCEYCGEPISRIGTTIVLCSCADSIQNEIVSRARRTSWARLRNEKLNEQKRIRQLARRQQRAQKGL